MPAAKIFRVDLDIIFSFLLAVRRNRLPIQSFSGRHVNSNNHSYHEKLTTGSETEDSANGNNATVGQDIREGS
jgi:hypothetical protein